MAMIQKPSMGGFALASRWIDESYDELAHDDSRTIAAGIVSLGIEVDGVVNSYGGPKAPPEDACVDPVNTALFRRRPCKRKKRPHDQGAKHFHQLRKRVANPREARWGDTRLDRVTYGDVVLWVAELTDRGLSPSRVTQTLLCLKQVLALAVMDGRLARNVAEHVKAPRSRKTEPRFLTHAEVARLADACGRHRAFILTAAYTGLRWGEIRALRVKRVDLERGRIDVAEAMPDESVVLDTPKNHKRRTVPVPRFVVEELALQVEGRSPDDLVFTNSDGGMLDQSNFRRNVWKPAVTACGFDWLTPHDLRHTTASLAVSAGANVKALQRLLGHASATVTLDTYSGLFDSDVDAVARRLDWTYRSDMGLLVPSEDGLKSKPRNVVSLDTLRTRQ
jgi:integrase